MKIVGQISKMVAAATTPVSYQLPLGGSRVPLNPFLKQTVTLRFMHSIICVGCGKQIKKSYQEGYCFPCTQRLARCDFCILKPDRCNFHLGACREPEWGQTHCMIPHWVYISNASGPKVGITRKSQVPTRWIDQGAVDALGIFEVPTRRISGLIEVVLAKYLSDRTNWRKMLTLIENVDLRTIAKTLINQAATDLQKITNEYGHETFKLIEAKSYQFEYPVMHYPSKVNSLTFDKMEVISGQLLGIKGQYLIFDCGVINVRKHTGYVVELEVEEGGGELSREGH